MVSNKQEVSTFTERQKTRASAIEHDSRVKHAPPYALLLLLLLLLPVAAQSHSPDDFPPRRTLTVEHQAARGTRFDGDSLDEACHGSGNQHRKCQERGSAPCHPTS